MLGAQPAALNPALRPSLTKIIQACAIAWDDDGFTHAWVDTCCIDKKSTAELAEAINSMWAWYRDAEVCYVFLADLPVGSYRDLELDLPRCKWFTRGWTLQELIAPARVKFFDREWNYRGSKRELAVLLSEITKIPVSLLRGEAKITDFAVARRMSWASARKTTKVEDTSYSLLGIFDVNMPLNYGEGEKAFLRLQTAIVQSTADMSIFAWKEDDRKPCPPFAGMLAESPRQFASCHEIETMLGDSAFGNFAITTRGIHTEVSQVNNLRAHDGNGQWHVALDTFCHINGVIQGVCVRRAAGGLCVRTNLDVRVELGSSAGIMLRDLYLSRIQAETLTLATRLLPQYPFHPGGDNPVLGNRFSALHVNWGPLQVSGQRTRTMPRSHWDAHDDLFFCCQPRTRPWCAFFAVGRLGDQRRVSLLLACFGWYRIPPTIVAVSLENMDSAMMALLEVQLQQIPFERMLPARDLILGVFDGKVVKKRIDTAVGDVEYISEPGSKWRVNIREELRPDMCVNPITVVDLSRA